MVSKDMTRAHHDVANHDRAHMIFFIKFRKGCLINIGDFRFTENSNNDLIEGYASKGSHPCVSHNSRCDDEVCVNVGGKER